MSLGSFGRNTDGAHSAFDKRIQSDNGALDIDVVQLKVDEFAKGSVWLRLLRYINVRAALVITVGNTNFYIMELEAEG